MDLDNNSHSVFLLHYHLILVIKYRRPVFDTDISKRAKEIFEYISPNYNITLEEWNHDKDHVHILFKAHPNTEISKFINAYKSASSRLLKKVASVSNTGKVTAKKKGSATITVKTFNGKKARLKIKVK